MVSGSYSAPEDLHLITKVFQGFSETHDLTLLSTAIAEHGSWEWAACRQGEINHYISLALTEDSGVTAPSRFYTVEVWAEADKDLSFTHRLVATFRAQASSFDSGVFQDQLLRLLDAAWEQARAFTVEDLTESYIVARGTSRR